MPATVRPCAHFPQIDRSGGLPGSEAWGTQHADGTWVSPATLQLGEPAVLAERTGIPVMSNFRSRDVAAGGTGAPLVPLIDHLLYSDAARNRAVLNIGGIANITALRAGEQLDSMVAFDTGPGNMVIDGIMSEITNGEHHLDLGGGLARKGKADDAVVDALLKQSFFQAPPPRAAGRGEFGMEFTQDLLRRCRAKKLSDAGIAATATALTTRAIRQACRDHLQFEPDEIIVSGGGAHNVAMLEQLSSLFPKGKVVTSDYYGLDVDAKEALAFALLANLSLDGRTGNVPSVTGARHAVVLGDLTPGGHR